MYIVASIISAQFVQSIACWQAISPSNSLVNPSILHVLPLPQTHIVLEPQDAHMAHLHRVQGQHNGPDGGASTKDGSATAKAAAGHRFCDGLQNIGFLGYSGRFKRLLSSFSFQKSAACGMAWKCVNGMKIFSGRNKEASSKSALLPISLIILPRPFLSNTLLTFLLYVPTTILQSIQLPQQLTTNHR